MKRCVVLFLLLIGLLTVAAVIERPAVEKTYRFNDALSMKTGDAFAGSLIGP